MPGRKAPKDLAGIIANCEDYDKTPKEVESCFPKSISHIKKLYGLLRECDEKGLCDKHGAGFIKSFFLAIEEANTGFESDLDEYMMEVKKIAYQSVLNPKTYLLESKIKNPKDLEDKQLLKLYNEYYDAINNLQEYMFLNQEKMTALDRDTIETVLDRFAEAALALCVYVSSQPDAEGRFKRDCSEFKASRK
jgi:hypothetical protein